MKNKTYRKIDKKFLRQRKTKNYELYEHEKFIKFLKHYKIYSFDEKDRIKEIREQRKQQLKEIDNYIKEKNKQIAQKQQQPTKSQILPNKTEFSAYQIKLFKIINEIFDAITIEKNIMFIPEILEEFRLYLPDLIKYFDFKYYRDKNLIKIDVRDLHKILEIKQILKQMQQI